MTPYRYPGFRRQIFIADLRFRGGRRPGDAMPEFDLPTTDGQRIRRADYVGRQPLFIAFASITCPLANSAVVLHRSLHAEFGAQIGFATIYVREAHPGERFPQPQTMKAKLAHAQAYHRMHQLPWHVAVDGIDGELHRALGSRSTAAYLIDTSGRIAARVLCSNDYGALRRELHQLASGQSATASEHQHLMVPLLRGIGAMDQTLELAGQQAREDVRHELPVGYALVRLAGFFPIRSPLGRSLAAVTSIMAGLLLLSRFWPDSSRDRA